MKNTTPKAMRDFEEPSKIPTSSRATTTKPPVTPTGRSNYLRRTSCPPSLHGLVITPVSGASSPSSPSSPRSARGLSSPFSTSTSGTPTGKINLFSKLLEKDDEAGHEECRWCDRVESSALNQRPDDPADALEWRKRDTFSVDDPLHTLHILDVDAAKKKGGGGGEEEASHAV